MREFLHKITKEEEGMIVGDIIRRNFDISSNLLSNLKNTSGILLNGEKVTVRKKVLYMDVLRLVLVDKKSENIVAVNMPIDIVYEDEDILAVNKSTNMPVHPSINNYQNTLANAVMYYYRDIPFTFRAVNRLDRDTTGIVIIAKNAYSADILSKQMREGMFKKTYVAVVEGVPEKKQDIIDAPIARECESMIKRCVRSDGKRAVTEYEVVEEWGDVSLVRILLHTGRTHQIRVHFSHIGHPLKYDYLYGREQEGKSFFLHCESVEFCHPITGEKLVISAQFDKKISDL